MKIHSGVMAKGTAEDIQQNLDRTEFTSQFKFLNDQNGLRRGELHTLTSPKGSGKSTLIRTMILEVACRRKKVLVILSEEMVDLYKINIWKSCFEAFQCEEKVNEFMANLLFVTELELEDKDPDNFFKNILEISIANDIDFLVYDNFTTGLISQLPIGAQGGALNKFKEITTKYNFATLLVFHTAKGTSVYNKILDGDDIRGNASAVNMGSYNYLLATFYNENPIRAFLICDKARYHSKANKKVYELNYDTSTGLYMGDMRSSYDEMQAIINRAKRAGSGGKTNVSI